MSKPLTHLGQLSVARFMRDYWQRRPLLIRNALPDFQSPLDRTALLALAQRDDVESRLITAHGGHWRLRHGPLPARSIPSLRKAHWTVLVQGVDLHTDAGAELLARFRFVPDARLDDLMVSYAADGGGVGPHVDSYDVFLLQAQGRRRWRISRQKDLDLAPGLPLRRLADFRPTREWVLQAGDLLYLPPGVAHDGVALGGDCITCSIGFRAPTPRELLDPWLDALAARAQLKSHYSDRGLAPARHPARLPGIMIDSAHDALRRLRPQRADATQALLAVLAEPKPQVAFRPARPMPMGRFLRRAASGGLRLDRRTRLLYEGGWFGINGEVFRSHGQERRCLARLADQRRLDGKALQTSASLAERLRQWYHAGWICFDEFGHE